MSIWDLLDPIYTGLESAADFALKPAKGKKQYKEQFAHLTQEIEDLKKTKESLDEALKGPETGLNPAPDIGEGKILVGEEGIKAAQERRRKKYVESIKRFGGVQVPEGTDANDEDILEGDEQAYWQAYLESKGGYTVDITATVPRDALEQYRRMTGKDKVILWGVDEAMRNRLSMNELLSRAYGDYQEIIDFRRSMIMEYRRSKKISPDVDVPLF
jgi:hypothetical protein